MSQAAIPPDQLRRLMAAFRQGQAARDALAAALDPHSVYSELPDPPPVLLVVRGELVEVKPLSLYAAAAAAAPPAPQPQPNQPNRGRTP